MSIAGDTNGLERVGALLYKLFVLPSALLSLSSLGCAFLIGASYLIYRRWSRGRRASLRLILRAVFPKRMFTSQSSGVDLLYAVLSLTVIGAMFGWAIMSSVWVSSRVVEGLTSLLGPVQASTAPDVTTRMSITLALFLAYEFGYWLDHYSSHRIRMFWELHKVHHSAEVLTPLTVFRLHPFEGVKFGNILAVTIGPVLGVISYVFPGAQSYSISGGNLILVVFLHLFTHLQHSQIWIPLRGIAGRIILSPAHHQVHHSSNPKHFDRNFGASLAVWDWLFGTLYIPAKEPERLSFGVEANGRHDHSIAGVFFEPASRFFAQALKLVGRRPKARLEAPRTGIKAS